MQPIDLSRFMFALDAVRESKCLQPHFEDYCSTLQLQLEDSIVKQLCGMSFASKPSGDISATCLNISISFAAHSVLCAPPSHPQDPSQDYDAHFRPSAPSRQVTDDLVGKTIGRNACFATCRSCCCAFCGCRGAVALPPRGF